MFPDGYFSITFSQLIGFAITIVSVWLIVRQLNESRLASQMEGMLALGEKDIELDKHRKLLAPIVLTDEWRALGDTEAYELIHGDEDIEEAYYSVLRYFERLGILVRRKALDRTIAYDLYGSAVPRWWDNLEKVTIQRRKEQNLAEFGEHWEWLAKEFRDFSG